MATLDYSIDLALCVGVYVLCLASWHAFELGIPLRTAFTAVLAGSCGAIGLAASFPSGRRAFGGIAVELGSAWPSAIVLLLNAAAASALLMLPLTAADLSLTTIGNNDLHHYIRLAGYLLDDGTTAGNIFQNDLHQGARHDVFGAYALLAFVGFLRHTAPVYVAEIPVIASIALVATFAARICRSTWQLPWVVCALIGAAIIPNGLFAYTAMHYFLSQLVAASLFVGAAAHFIEAGGRGRLTTLNIGIGQLALLGSLLFVYPAVVLPVGLSCALLTFWLVLIQRGWSIRRSAFRAFAVATGAVVAASGLVFIGAPARFAIAVERSVMYMQPDVVGWPLDFVHPATLASIRLFGAPFFDDSTTAVAGVAETCVILLITTSLALWSRRGGKTARQGWLRATPVLFFLVLLVAYFFVWERFHVSYQQWKFAFSFPLLFSFAIAGSACGLVHQLTRPRQRVTAALCVVLLAVTALNAVAVERTLYSRVSHYPTTMRALSAIDNIQGIERVYVDMPGDPGARMLAANFIGRPELAFFQSTYYDHVVDTAHATPAAPILRQFAQRCEGPGRIPVGEGFFLATEDAPPVVKAGVVVLFDRPVSACLDATGLSVPESAGAWSDGSSAQITFVCECDAAQGGYAVTLVAHAFIDGSVSRQRVAIARNGVAVGEWSVSDNADHSIVIALPRATAGPTPIRLDMSFPDAKSPASLGLSRDSRLLGFQFVSLSVVNVNP